MNPIKLSQVDKLDGILSWSLPAGKSCPYSTAGGETDIVCKLCYAKGGFYSMPDAIKIRHGRMGEWQKADWVDRMIFTLNRMIPRRKFSDNVFFRWFDSGDMYHPLLAEKMLAIMSLTPTVNHWLPTRAYKHPEAKKYCEAMKQLPNVCVRYSSPNANGKYVRGLHGSVVITNCQGQDADGEYFLTSEVFICPAWDNAAVHCNGCRACWMKEVKVIAYVAHGPSMLKHLQAKGEFLQRDMTREEWIKESRHNPVAYRKPVLG